ncbi:MAG TPA: hypothetical protein VFF65_09720, partial [Phycisphaerales bacterium]|nr:hypothetical protein [Phycisphaerales bacterium]
KRAQWGDTSGGGTSGSAERADRPGRGPIPTRGGMDASHGAMGTDKITFGKKAAEPDTDQE